MISFGGDNGEDTRDLMPGFRLAYGVLAVSVLIIFSRLWYLQIVEGDELRKFSEKNRVKENRIRAARGLILDRHGDILVDNAIGYDATLTPQYLTSSDITAASVGATLNQDPAKIKESIRVGRFRNGAGSPVTIKENLSYEEVFRLQKLRFDNTGLNIEERVLRSYPLEENGAQLFGYVGEVSKKQLENYNAKHNNVPPLDQGAIIGQSGLEEVWDQEVRGKDGISFTEVDAHGRESPAASEKVLFELKPQAEVPGYNVVLTIDKEIQIAAHKALLEQKDAIGPRIGGIVVMKTNGEILAWTNTPSFNPNKFARGIANNIWTELINHPFKPLRNKVIQDHFAPGSTLKPIVALAALQEGVVTPTKIISAPGQMRFGNRMYHDSLKQGHGEITVYQAIESSSNIFFYKMGIALGIDNIAKYAKAMGLGTKTNIGLSNEAVGVFPTKEWKLKAKGEIWQPGENLSNAIGQGFVLVNLLQMAVAYNTIATTGKVVRPFIVEKLVAEDGSIIKKFEPQILRDISQPDQNGLFIDKAHFAVVQEAMRRVANGARGTARYWKIPGIEFAGKTGTSQVMSFSADEIYDKCERRPLAQRHHGSFIGYAPANNPEIVVAVLTEHSCHGSTGSVPVVRDVMLAYFRKYRPDLLKEKIKVQPTAVKIEVEQEIVE
jgi:penicillin-binding protein 2